MNGVFITFEGGEGAGKTTVLQQLKKHFSNEGYDVITTREPGGIDIAEDIRSIILNKKNTAMDERTEVLLYAAARRQHLVEKVIPALDAGKIVLCDRFIDSSLAYQGYARGNDIKDVLLVNQFAIGATMPDLTLYFDIDPKEGLARVKEDPSREVNRLDLEKIEFHYKVREGYHLLLEQFPERIKWIDARENIVNVTEKAKRHIEHFFNNRKV